MFIIFLFFEKNYNNIFFSKKSRWTNTFSYISYKQLKALAVFLKFETLKNIFYLADSSALDNFFSNINKKNVYLYYIFTSFKSSLSTIFFVKINNTPNNSLIFFFKNSNWLEREVMEMYGIFFRYKKDYRKLLLDYSKKINPLKKNFNCEGFDEYFFNFFENQVCFINSPVIEL